MTIQQSHVLTEIKKKEQCSVLKVLTSANPLQVRDIRPSILLALETILCSWIFQDKLLSTSRPKSLNSETTSRCFIHTEISLYSTGNFNISLEHLKEKALHALFSLRKHTNFSKLKPSLACKIFETMISPILSYNS